MTTRRVALPLAAAAALAVAAGSIATAAGDEAAETQTYTIPVDGGAYTVEVEDGVLRSMVLTPDAAPTPDPRPAPSQPPVPPPGGGEPPSDGGPVDQQRLFAGADWLYEPIPDGPEIDPSSDRWVALLEDSRPFANIGDYGVPLYDVTGGEQRLEVGLREDWGANPFVADPAPLTSAFLPSPGTDGAMSVIDRGAGKAYEFWQYEWRDGDPVASWGAIADLDGDGSDWRLPTGAGIARAAGVVTMDELAQGRIDHALVFSTDNSGSGFRYPASKSDGDKGGDAIPEGARFQLDPAFDVSTIENPATRAVARALQVYGAYNIDNGGAAMALIFETPVTENDVYPSLGWTSGGYELLDEIPMDRFHVLADWDG